jgi:hypothetical protein
MRRTIIYLAIFLPVCLVFIPQQSPIALSFGGSSSSADSYQDDGKGLPVEKRFAELAAKDPVAFLDACLKRQHREIQGYRGILTKQERIKDKDNPQEVIEFCFREQPYSVLMKWREGARDGKASLYVQGENRDRIAVLTNTRIPITWDIDPEGTIAQHAGRYCIRDFSLRQATERTMAAWKTAQEKGTLQVEFLGKKAVPALDNRVCYLLKRTCNPPEEEGTTQVEIAIDAETWLQTGSTLTAGDGHLIGRYEFTKMQINPDFETDLFKRESLKK